MECDVCGKPMKKTTWTEEYWGSMVKLDEYECLNPNCGLEEDEEDE